VRLACERIDEEKAPFRDVWTYASLGRALRAQTGYDLSVSEIGRILRFADLRPHRVKQWLHCPDPDFAAKAKIVCDLYLAPPKGAVVLSIDEKPLQALERLHPTHTNPVDGSLRYEFEYKRHGTQALLAAFDTRSGKVAGAVVPKRSAAALVSFMERVAMLYPTQQVYVVWDNLNIHYDGKDARWSAFNRRHGHRFHFRYTPIHASWMNQVEIWFSILQRRILRHASFPSLTEQRQRILAFVRHWNRHERHPFRWTWRSDRPQNRQLRRP
jgi:transposase